MGLAKLTITPLDKNKAELTAGALTALFNPKEYTISKSVPWNPQATAGLDAPEMQFTMGQGETLQLELFFDTFEQRSPVTAHTDKLHKMALIDADLHRPPMVLLSWGKLKFTGVIESLTHRFTMFLEDGTPVRATCSVNLREARDAKEQSKDTKKASPDHAKLRAVRRGETLQSIAADEYDDPAEWRRIADANGIDDPFRLEPGIRLIVPPILS
jgi:hypothetical protein